jgi:indole-3-pyruvate monooxygenase
MERGTGMATPTVIIVGAGAAGLATGACLRQRGIRATIFEAGDAPGMTWRRLYDRLHLHTVKGLSGLPGLPMPRSYPRYPSRQQVIDYLTAYAKHFALDIRYKSPVTRAVPHGTGWEVTTPDGTHAADVLVVASGIFSQPTIARYPGMADFGGRIVAAADYQTPDPFKGQRVLVIGAGNTGAEISVDLAEHGAQPTIAIRAGAHVVPRELLGMPIQRLAHLMVALPPGITRRMTPILMRRSAQRQARAGVPKPPGTLLDKPGVPIIGLELLHLAQTGKVAVAGAIERFTATGVQFADGKEVPFDAIIVATGYRPALDYLGDAITRDDKGRPATDGVRAVGATNLYFVGMHYDIRGTLFNIAQEAPIAAAAIAAGT